MIEFYGELSEQTYKLAERLKRRVYARWMFVLSGIVAAVTVISALTQSAFVVPLVCAIVLLGVGFYLHFAPPRRAAKIRLRVQIDEGEVCLVQYLSEKTREKKRRRSAVRRVYKTPSCYFLVFSDLSDAIVCERCLLKQGTFARLEELFEDKLREKSFFGE